MADRTHLAVIRHGVQAWNQWRRVNPSIRPELSHANLVGAHLCEADLAYTDLFWADLAHANLHKANLSGANLFCAILCGANVHETVLHNADITDTCLDRRHHRTQRRAVWFFNPRWLQSGNGFREAIAGSVLVSAQACAR